MARRIIVQIEIFLTNAILTLTKIVPIRTYAFISNIIMTTKIFIQYVLEYHKAICTSGLRLSNNVVVATYVDSTAIIEATNSPVESSSLIQSNIYVNKNDISLEINGIEQQGYLALSEVTKSCINSSMLWTWFRGLASSG